MDAPPNPPSRGGRGLANGVAKQSAWEYVWKFQWEYIVWRFGVPHVFVNFVSDYVNIMLEAQMHNRFQFTSGKDFACWIMWRI
jgi:hypothetical protein